MSRRYQLTATAEQTIDEIGAFIAEDSVDAALKVYDALEEAFDLLAENPGIGYSNGFWGSPSRDTPLPSFGGGGNFSVGGGGNFP